MATTTYRLSKQRKNDFKLRDDDQNLTNLQTDVIFLIVYADGSLAEMYAHFGIARFRPFHQSSREETMIFSSLNLDLVYIQYSLSISKSLPSMPLAA